MRRSQRDVANDRQRTLFGIDRLERVIGDALSEVVRLKERVDELCVDRDPQFVSRETRHFERVKEWLLQYEETQRAEWNGIKEADDGTS